MTGMTGKHTKDWFLLGAGACAAVAVASMWLPWFRSGSAGRNSFAAFRAAQILGIEWITPFRVVWFLLPVLLLVAAAARLFEVRPASAVVLILLGIVLGSFGGLAVLAFGVHVGAAAAGVTGLCTIVLAVPALRR